MNKSESLERLKILTEKLRPFEEIIKEQGNGYVELKRSNIKIVLT